MKIKFEQLQNSLQGPLAPIYLITGEETLLIEESCQMIRSRAKQQQFDERHSFFVESGFNWKNFQEASNSLSLFSDNILLELHFKNGLNAQAQNALSAYLKNPPKNKLLIITVPKLEKSAASHANIKTIEKIGIITQIWPITIAQLPYWIRNRLKQLKLTVANDAIQFIASQVEGNLLAAHQEIEKLALLYGTPAQLSLEDVMHAIHDNARYDIFKLTDNMLSGNTQRSFRIFKNLQEEGVEPTLILWAITREIRLLLTLLEESQQNNQPIESLWKKHHIWEKRQPLIKQALNRHNKNSLKQLLQAAIKIDPIIKSNQAHQAWHAFSEIIFQFTQPGIMRHDASQ